MPFQNAGDNHARRSLDIPAVALFLGRKSIRTSNYGRAESVAGACLGDPPLAAATSHWSTDDDPREHPHCMMGALARWRKPEKQTAYDAALARGAKLGIKEWVVPRERMELGSK